MREVETMKRTTLLSLVVVAVVGMLAMLGIMAGTVLAAEDGLVEVVILHDTHVHGNLDSVGADDSPVTLAHYATVLNALRQERPGALFLGAGDDLGSGPLSILFGSEPVVRGFNLIGLDANTYGNHDFDSGDEEALRGVELSEFPWVSANIRDSETGEVFGHQHGALEYLVREVDGVRVGITGVSHDHMHTISGMSDAVLNLDPVTEVRRVVRHLREVEQVDLTVVMAHLDPETEVRMAEEVAGLDLILGAHYPEVFDSPRLIGDTLLSKAGDEYTYLAEVTFLFRRIDEQVERLGWAYTRHDVTSQVVPDPHVNLFVAEWLAQLDDALGEIIGHTTTPLERDARYEQDIALGNLITDAFLYLTEADIALTNNGGIRASIPAGDFSARDIYQVLPFGNEVVVLEIAGSDLRDAIALGYERRNQNDLQVAGASYEIIVDADDQLVDLRLTIDGEAIDPERTYQLATLDYLAEGGSEYPFPDTATVLHLTGVTDAEAVIRYLQEIGTVDYPETEGRIQITRQ
jgi:2',3'-cyclic-nucleotide 2'-phosphodiesterase (5'-nucleotidase family)